MFSRKMMLTKKQKIFFLFVSIILTIILAITFNFKVVSDVIYDIGKEKIDRMFPMHEYFIKRRGLYFYVESDRKINSLLCFTRFMRKLREFKDLKKYIIFEKPMDTYLNKYGIYLASMTDIDFISRYFDDLYYHTLGAGDFSDFIYRFSVFQQKALMDERNDPLFEYRFSSYNNVGRKNRSKYFLENYVEGISAFFEISKLYLDGKIDLSPEEYEVVIRNILFQNPSFFSGRDIFIAGNSVLYIVHINYNPFEADIGGYVSHQLSLFLEEIRKDALIENLGCKIYVKGGIYNAPRKAVELKQDISRASFIAVVLSLLAFLFMYPTIYIVFPISLFVLSLFLLLHLYIIIFERFTFFSIILISILIGVGIDYFIHIFGFTISSGKDRSFKPIIKDIFHMFLTTSGSIIVLFVSDMISVKHLSIFTVSALLLSFLISTLTIPLVREATLRRRIFTPPKIYRWYIIPMFLIPLIVFIFLSLRLDYYPTKLLQFDKFAKISTELGFYPAYSVIFLQYSNDVSATAKKLSSDDLVGFVISGYDWLPDNIQSKRKMIYEFSRKCNGKNKHHTAVFLHNNRRHESSVGRNSEISVSLSESLSKFQQTQLAFAQMLGVYGEPRRKKLLSTTSYIIENWNDLHNETNSPSFQKLNKLMIESLNITRKKICDSFNMFPHGIPSELEETYGKNLTYVFVFPKKNLDPSKNYDELTKYIGILQKYGVFLSYAGMIKFVYDSIHHDFNLLVPIGVFISFVILILSLGRNWKWGFLGILSESFGFLAGFTALYIAGGFISFPVIFGVLLVFGTLDDDFILVINSLEREGIEAMGRIIPSTFLTSFTTASAGLGMSFAHVEEIAHLGVFLFVSMVAGWLANILLVPSLWKVIKGRLREN